MKSILLALIASTSLVHADFARAELGGGIWSHSVSGELTYPKESAAIDLDATLGFDAARPLYLWAYLKHPIPLIPNVRLEYLNLAEEEHTNTPLPSGYKSTLKSEQIDLLLYYNLLDNLLWLTWDLGGGLVQVRNEYGNGVSSKREEALLPVLYTRIRAELPTTALGIEGELQYGEYDQCKISDLRVKIDYTFDLIPMVRPALEIGYRVQNMILQDGVLNEIDIENDWTFSGPYFGAALRF